MNETRIALAFVALGIALLIGTFAYLAYDRGAASSAETTAARSATTATAGEQARRSGAQNATEGPTMTEADPRPAQAEGDEPAPSDDAIPSGGRQTAPSNSTVTEVVGPNAPVARVAVPAYDPPLRESHADGVTEVVVGTEATDEAGMRLVASDLASYYPGDGVLLVEFREGADGDPEAGRESGFALVFGSREAALAPDLNYTPEEVDEVFEEDGGVRAVSYGEFGEENPALKDDLDRIRAS